MQNRHERVVWCGRPVVALRLTLLLLVGLLTLAPGPLAAQRVLTQPNRVVTLPRGASALIQFPEQIQRVSVGIPEIANYEVLTPREGLAPRELLLNALAVGTTTLLVWDRLERVEMISVVVTPDIGSLQQQIQLLFPDASVTLSASGNAIIVSGQLRDPTLGRRILEVVRSSGASTNVIDNLQTPAQRQVLLHVRFAEVNRSALTRLNADLTVSNPQDLGGALDNTSLLDIETLAEGVVRLFLLGDNGSSLEAVIRALKTQGNLRSLAEPNLIAIEGQQATFLAGGEFPFPVVQGSQSGGAVTIAWKEFGVRLNFTPTITNIGTIRLSVSPEVSSLDFANGLTFSGFQIPALLTRRVETSIELRPGQHLAIGGLLDNSTLKEWQKLPLLGDLPVLGALFRSQSVRDRNTELLILVTPHLVEPLDTPPGLPTGEPAEWERTRYMHEGTLKLPAGVRIIPIPRDPGA